MATPELDRVLDTLLHDLRSPMGVASGYVRLLRQGRIADPAEVDRLLAKTQDALRAMSTLCADVSAWRDAEPLAHVQVIAVDDFTRAVVSHLAETGAPIHRETLGRTMTLLDDPDRVAAAVATVLAAVAVARMQRVSIAIHVIDDALHFDADDPGADVGLQPFDPWQYGGLQVPLACRTIARAGGQWRTEARAGSAVAMVFPIGDLSSANRQ
jgi:signal transduction histidine kinase